MGKREGILEGYENSYSYQKEVCYIRRVFNLTCKNCRYLRKCKNSNRVIEKLNKDLATYPPRSV